MAHIVLGVSGGIGAYKAVEIARGLQDRGHTVTAVLTRAARRFVGPLTFEAITQRPVVTSLWTPGTNASIEHIALAGEADLLLVAPATATTIARLAHGLASDMLSAIYLATAAPVLLAPAMNTQMLAHPAVQANLETLVARGARVVEPGDGYLACGTIGRGRLADPAVIVEAAHALVQSSGDLAGRRVLVTAGPTVEDLDPVRFISNRSSGRMGYAVAEQAARRGAAVQLVSGPTSLATPHGVERIDVRSAREMHAAVMARASETDLVVMAAAVADYTPADVASQKVAKQDGPLRVTLVRTPDILADLGRLPSRRDGRPLLVGFAAETHDVLTRAEGKLRSKAADLIVANDVTRPDAGFDVETNAVTFVTADGTETLPVLPKREVAARLLDRVAPRLAAPRTGRHA